MENHSQKLGLVNCKIRKRNSQSKLSTSQRGLVKVKSLFTSQKAHQAGTYLQFISMKRLGVFLLPPGWGC